MGDELAIEKREKDRSSIGTVSGGYGLLRLSYSEEDICLRTGAGYDFSLLSMNYDFIT
jgi:hypothetical protein